MIRVSFARAWWACALVLLVAVGGAGVAMAAEEAAPSEKPPEATVMPEWAPDDPSDEFLIGLRALAAVPGEQVLKPAEGNAELTAFLTQMMEEVWPPAFEFFGALTEEQRATFFAKNEVRMEMSSVPEAPRATLDRWFAAMDRMLAATPEGVWPEEDGPPEGGYLELLRDDGAADDFSNVEVGFGARSGMVGLYFWIEPIDGGPGGLVTNDFAMLKGDQPVQPAADE
jgi:hypothetical protein